MAIAMAKTNNYSPIALYFYVPENVTQMIIHTEFDIYIE